MLIAYCLPAYYLFAILSPYRERFAGGAMKLTIEGVKGEIGQLLVPDEDQEKRAAVETLLESLERCGIRRITDWWGIQSIVAKLCALQDLGLRADVCVSYKSRRRMPQDDAYALRQDLRLWTSHRLRRVLAEGLRRIAEIDAANAIDSKAG